MEKVLKVLAKYLNVKGLLLDYLYDDIISDAVDSLVAKSDNTVDDAIASMLKPLLRDELEKRLDDALAKLDEPTV